MTGGAAPSAVPRRAAVLGLPVEHSLSPVLHGAAYAALGLDGWTYQRVECDARALPGWVGERDASWVGLSVTMPGKRAALAVASSATPRARAVGVANTLVRRDGGGSGWHADCTDVDGVAEALRGAGAQAAAHAVMLGAGGTASAAMAGLAEVGVQVVTVVVRDAARAAETLAVATEVGLEARTVPWSGASAAVEGAGVLLNTTPAGAADAYADGLVDELGAGAVVLDAVYHPWPTPLAVAAGARGLALATGLDVLLHQAFGQVELFTAAPAPRAAMHAALVDATGFAVRPVS